MAATLILAIQGCASPAGTDASLSGGPAAIAQRTAHRFEYARLAMGSRVSIVLYAEQEPVEPVRRAFAVIDRYENALSDYDPRSEAMRLVRAEVLAWQPVSDELLEALQASQAAWYASGGTFDTTIGPVTALWREANRTGHQPTEDQITQAARAVGMEFVEIDPHARRARVLRSAMQLDFGGIGKGLAADAALRSLRTDGISSSLVDIGGDIALGDPPPGMDGWRIRVSTGSGGQSLPLTLHNRGVATSGDVYRFHIIDERRRSHVLDPATGSPAQAGSVVSVVAASAWRADALATIAKAGGERNARDAAAKLGGARIDVLRAESQE